MEKCCVFTVFNVFTGKIFAISISERLTGKTLVVCSQKNDIRVAE